MKCFIPDKGIICDFNGFCQAKAGSRNTLSQPLCGCQLPLKRAPLGAAPEASLRRGFEAPGKLSCGVFSAENGRQAPGGAGAKRLRGLLCALEERVLTNPLHVLAERDLRQGLAVEEGNKFTIKYRVSFEQFMNKEQASA